MRLLVKYSKFISPLVGVLLITVYTNPLFAVTKIEPKQCITNLTPQYIKKNQRHIYIKEIKLQINNIFDLNNPDENHTLYRWANKFHIQTNKNVVVKDLLFKEGEPINLSNLEESERLLRSRQYIWDAKVEVVKICGNQATILVTTRDVWTLQPSADFGRAGGKNKFAFAISDSSFLGTGRLLEISRFSNFDRTGYQLGFNDHDFLENRWQLEMSYADNSDGYSQFVQLKRPFYALDIKWEAGGFFLKTKKDEQIYFRGDIVDEFSHREEGFGFSYGHSNGNVNDQIQRFRFGYKYYRDTFTPSIESTPFSDISADRTFSYPWFGWEYIEDKFEVLSNILQIQRTEDINLGWRVNTSIGYSADALGGDLNRWILKGSASKFFIDSNLNIWQWDANLSSNYAEGRIENGLLQSNVNFYSHQDSWHRFYFGLKTTLAKNLYKENQLTLGGDTGLRGYPIRYQTGNRMILATIEERFYFNQELWHLFNVGAAIFVDSGRAWFDNRDNGSLDAGILTNAGIGLRLSSTRAGHNRVIHIDLAKPIGAEGDVSGLQLTVTLKSEF